MNRTARLLARDWLPGWIASLSLPLAAGLGGVALLAALLTVSLGPAEAQAAEFEWGEIEATVDTTVTVGATLRVESPDSSNVCTVLGGSGGNCGGTDGNLNYKRGRITSSTVQATHEVDVRWRNFGLFTRVNYFYDSENHDGSRRFSPLVGKARKESGADWELLDGYVSASFTPMEMPLTIKVGEQVINWGESTFIPNGLNVINPIDVSRLRSPGAELREALLPIPAAYMSIGVTENITLEGFWQWSWRETQLDPAGTFFSTSDALGPGGKNFDISLGHNDCGSNPLIFGVRSDGTVGGSCLRRGANVKPKDRNQWGVAVRLFVPWLNSAEIGLYAINYHSRLPYVGGSYGERIDLATEPDALAAITRGLSQLVAQQDYPEDIRKYGVSLSTTIEALDLAVQGEVSWSKDFPLQLAEQQGLRALVTGAGIPTIAPLPGVRIAAPGEFTSGGFDHRVYTGQLSLTKLVEPGPIVGGFLGASQLALVGEAGFVRVRGLESTGKIAFQGAVTPQAIVEGNTADLDSDFAQKFSWGVVAVARLQYNNAIWGWNLAPSVAYRHDINGTSPTPIGNFVEDRKGLTLGLQGDYLNKWAFNLTYSIFTGAGKENTLRDRDFVSLSLQYSF